MKRFIATLTNIFKIEDLRVRIINTILLLLIYRVGSFIVLPGVDPTLIETKTQDGILGLLNMFAGGSFSRASVFALGVMPYISASIVVQLFGIVIPYFQRLQKEGESGRKKVNQITRYLTIFITAGQAIGYVKTQVPPEAIMVDSFLFSLSSILILTTGTMFVMWLGERITDKGLGNGISLIIMIGIIAQLPLAFSSELVSRMGMNGGGLIPFIIELAALAFVVILVILLVQGTRKIPVQYAKQVAGSKMSVGGERQYIPLKLNASGVMPIIFAQALMFIPGLVAQSFAEKSEFASSVAQAFGDFTTWQYNALFAFLIIVFTFFYTAISINPTQISDDMKRGGGFVPGVKPGEDTSNFIANILDRITLPGAFMLSAIAILPAVANLFGVTRGFASFFGGTSLLILVGVVLDTLQQIESYLLMRKYEGLMQSGRIKGRSEVITR